LPQIVTDQYKHVGHASPTPGPFHQTKYVASQTSVFAGLGNVIRAGDATACGDPVVGTSPNVYCEGQLVHRQGDATGGHGSWGPNSALNGFFSVLVNE